MKRFMIGQHKSFDDAKYARDFRKGFYGIEACMLENESEIDKLVAASEQDKFNIGIHFPLRGWVSKQRDPQFLSKDGDIRKQFYQLMEEEFMYLQKIKPKYILFHYPKPVILDDRVDWKLWRFGDKSEYIFESDYSFEELCKSSEYLFSWLTKKSTEFDFIPVLEFDALNKYIYETNFLEGLLDKYPKIKICLDTGRLHYQERIDENFNAMDIIKRFAKYAEIVHLWNAKITEVIENNHYPTLPALKTEDGWAPIEEYIRSINQENKHTKILFEHASHLISDEELQVCYDWIAKLIKNE
jgi:adenylate kinase family enzyme